MYLKGKYPLKDNNVIGKMYEDRLGSNVSEDECSDIVKYMYNESDSAQILEKLESLFFVVNEKTLPYFLFLSQI